MNPVPNAYQRIMNDSIIKIVELADGMCPIIEELGDVFVVQGRDCKVFIVKNGVDLRVAKPETKTKEEDSKWLERQEQESGLNTHTILLGVAVMAACIVMLGLLLLGLNG